MQSLRFYQLPLVVKIAVGVVFNNAWWSIEEFVIDRVGLWKYMPYYRVAKGCVWDLAVALISFSYLACVLSGQESNRISHVEA